jgi:hypothetical protein
VHEPTIRLSRTSQLTAGFLLVSVVAVEFGGWHLTNVSRGLVNLTDFQVSFNRAGHAHAGVLVTLALVGVILADSTRSTGWMFWVSRLAIPSAAVLMPAGFFLSSAGNGRTEASDWIVLLWIGAASLAIGVIALGVSLIRAGWPRNDVAPHALHDRPADGVRP